MKILRTIFLVMVFVGFLTFAIYNWKPVEVTLWQNLVLETKIPVLGLLAFALGFVPMWVYYLSVKWGLNRRVRRLENSLKSTALARQHEPRPVAAPVDKAGDKPGTEEGQAEGPLSPATGGDRP